MVRCWAQILFFLIVVVLGTASMLSGCGQKGPLYLPEETPENQSQPSPAKPSEKR